MSKKVINISKKKLSLGNITLEPLKPVVLKDIELTTSVQKALDGYLNLGFIRVFDIQEQPLLFTQTEEYKQEVETKVQQIEIEKLEVKQSKVETEKVEEKQEEKKPSKNTKKKQIKKQEEVVEDKVVTENDDIKTEVKEDIKDE